MRIWVDADASPTDVKEVVFKAAKRTGMPVTLVANQKLRTPAGDHITSVMVPSGANVADQYIAEEMSAGDLVITADIPLASQVVERNGTALDFRGTLYTEDTIGSRLATRDLMDDLRGEGVVTSGPAAYGPKDKQQFANALDRWITAAKKEIVRQKRIAASKASSAEETE